MSNYTDDFAMAGSQNNHTINLYEEDKTAAQIALERVGNVEIEGLLKSTMGIYEDIATKGENSVFIKEGNSFWLTELPPEVLDTAKHILATYQPELVQKLERSLPQLERKCPDIRVLRHTTPYSQMKFIPHLPPRITNPQIYGGNNTEINQQTTTSKHMTNPTKRHQIPIGTIYSMTANGSRKETPMVKECQKQSTNPFVVERTDNTMFGYNNLYPNHTLGNVGV